MSLIILNVDEIKRTLSASGGAFVVHDKEVDIVRFAINSGFADITLDEHSALRVMYQRPGETEVRAQTLTYHDTDGLRNYYDWQLLSADLSEKGTLTVALCILRTDGDVEEWHTTPCQIRVLDTIHTDDSDEADETITPTVAQRVAVLETMIQRVASGAPIVVSSTSAMTDTEQIYVLSTDGEWYYHNGSAWVAGGEYGAVSTDTTLTQSGIPADAASTGKAVSDLNERLGYLDDAAETTDYISKYGIVSGRLDENGDISATSNWSTTEYIPVDVNDGDVLHLTCDVKEFTLFRCLYDADKNLASARTEITPKNGEYIYSPDDSAKFVRFSFSVAVSQTVTIRKSANVFYEIKYVARQIGEMLTFKQGTVDISGLPVFNYKRAYSTRVGSYIDSVAFDKYQAVLHAYDGTDYKGFYHEDGTFSANGSAFYMQTINVSSIRNRYPNYDYVIVVKLVDDTTVRVDEITNDIKISGTILSKLNALSQEKKAEYYQNITFAQGSIAKGKETGTTIRVRSSMLSAQNVKAVTLSEGYTAGITAWENGEWVGYLTTAGFFDGVEESTAPYLSDRYDMTYYGSKYPFYDYRLIIRKTDGSEITVPDVEANITFEYFNEKNKISENSDKLNVHPNDSFIRFNAIYEIYNPYKGKGSLALKGQLHCHTTNSDGRDTPEELYEKYKSAGYDFMTITDHNYITPCPVPNGGMVWLCNAYEDTHNESDYQHANVYNADNVLNRTSMTQNQNRIIDVVERFVMSGNGVASYNHPEYPQVYASDETLKNLPEGISFIEVWNGTIQRLMGTVQNVSDLPAVGHYGEMYYVSSISEYYACTSLNSSSPNWHEIDKAKYPDGNLNRGFKFALDSGKKIFCTAVDDCHFESSFNVGWVIAFSHSRDAASIWNALLSGCSYASSGVAYTDVSCRDGIISVDIDPVDGETYTTTFYGYGNTVLKSVVGTSAMYELTGSEAYVRAETVSSKNEQIKAWTQPVWVISKRKQYGF